MKAMKGYMKKYKLKGLDCAVCAANIEEELKKEENISFATVNFSTSELVVDADDEKRVFDVIKKVEPEIEISEIGEEERNSRREIFPILISGVLLAIGILFEQSIHTFQALEYTIFLSAYLIAGYKILWKAMRNLTRGTVLDENFLLSIATLGAIAIHEMPEAVAVMLFFRIGEFFQDLAVGKSRRSIRLC